MYCVVIVYGVFDYDCIFLVVLLWFYLEVDLCFVFVVEFVDVECV